MLFLTKKKDGGPASNVTGYWLIELKKLFTIVLLHFASGSREAYHSHAFNAITWFLKGTVEEHQLNGKVTQYRASWRPKITPRSNFHKVVSLGDTWAISFRGPWVDRWQEFREKTREMVTLTHGRKVVG